MGLLLRLRREVNEMLVTHQYVPLTIELQTDFEVKYFIKILDAAAASEDVDTYLRERGLSSVEINNIADFLEDLRTRI